MIWMNYNCGVQQGDSSGVVEKCLYSGSIFNMEMTGHVDKLNSRHEQRR